ncbi:MAG: transposase, partial [Fimbriimonadales bacterium]|nr:transposase [Fimbriimonadales bacterium]
KKLPMNTAHNTYEFCLTDQQWQLIEPLLPKRVYGTKPKHHPRDILNAILYILTTGCAWRHLPKHFPPYTTVSYHFHRWKRLGVWEQIYAHLREAVRLAHGKDPQPSTLIIDSQTVRSTPKGGSINPVQRRGTTRQRRSSGVSSLWR